MLYHSNKIKAKLWKELKVLNFQVSMYLVSYHYMLINSFIDKVKIFCSLRELIGNCKTFPVKHFQLPT